MALAVDTKHLLNVLLPVYEEYFNCKAGSLDQIGGRRLQLHRVCLYAIVSDTFVASKQFQLTDPRLRAALDWQAEQGDDEDEVEVLHHLKQVAASATKPGARPGRPSGGVDSRAGTTTLVASVQSPTFTSSTQHRSPSSFRRFSTRHASHDFFITNSSSAHMAAGCIRKFLDVPPSGPKIVSTDGNYTTGYFVTWFEQLDFLDCSSQSPYFPSHPGKRRRKINPFHHISPRPDEEHATRAHDHPAPEAKRFRGVRYRSDHNRWVAEMKPPKSKNKVSLGEFRSQTDAAHVVDVAFQHHGRPLNFPDSTPRIVAELPLSAGLSAEEKLKVQIKWMKGKLPTLQPSPPEAGVTSSTRNPSTSDTNSGLRPFSALGSSLNMVGSDDADDAASQPQRDWVQGLMSRSDMADGKETYGAGNGFGDGPQSSMMQWSVETAIAHDPSDGFGMSAEHCGGTVATMVSCQPMTDFSGLMVVDFTAASPPIPMRLGAFEVEVAGGSWGKEIAVGCDESLESRPLDCDDA